MVSGGRWTLILLDYYGRRLGLRAWTHLDRLEGGDTGEQILRSYLQRIDAFRGVPRVWFHLEGTRACEDEAILGYLNTIGKELYSVHFRLPGVSGASAYLYGLSDPELLTRTSADGYPLPECEILTVL